MTMPESELYWVDPKRELPKCNHSDVIVLYNNECYKATFIMNNGTNIFVIKHNDCPYIKQSTDVQGWLPIPNKKNIR
jgi:hypothetical protein